jgi:hypothetical protein
MEKFNKFSNAQQYFTGCNILRKSCHTPRTSSVEEFASFPKLPNFPLLLHLLECLCYCCFSYNTENVNLFVPNQYSSSNCSSKPDAKHILAKIHISKDYRGRKTQTGMSDHFKWWIMQPRQGKSKILPSCSSFADRFCNPTPKDRT